ncbi:MAG: hypothetical protein NTV30_07980 [Chloroflexi bacterium]|nr:hypothetical protein [Chloroflexota bacterium]
MQILSRPIKETAVTGLSNYSLEKRIERISMILWPWKEWKLAALVSVLIMLDFTSTFFMLTKNENVAEGGLLAGWALKAGGFAGLFLVDICVISFLIGSAFILRRFINRNSFEASGRAFFVVLLVPYVVSTFTAIFNNIVLTFK